MDFTDSLYACVWSGAVRCSMVMVCNKGSRESAYACVVWRGVGAYNEMSRKCVEKRKKKKNQKRIVVE